MAILEFLVLLPLMDMTVSTPRQVCRNNSKCSNLDTTFPVTTPAEKPLCDQSKPEVRVLKQTLKELGWTTCTVLYDTTSISLVNELTSPEKSNQTPMYFTMINVTSLQPKELQSRLITFQLSGPIPHNYVLMSDQVCAVQVLKVANKLDSLSNRYTYLQHQSRWLVLGSRDMSGNLLNVCTNLDNVALLTLPGCTSVIKHNESNTTESPTQSNIEVMTLLRSSKGRVWSSVSPLSRPDDQIILHRMFPNTQYGYNQRKLKVVTKTWLGFALKTVENGTTKYGGFCIDVLNQMAAILNFTYELSEPPDNEWGSEVKGEWIGIVGQLKRREIDFAMASLSRNSARDAVIDFVSTPFFKDYKDIMYRKLEVTKDWSLLLGIFRPTVLVCIGAALVGFTLLYFLIQFGPNEKRHQEHCRNVSNVGLYMFGGLFSQGGETLPTSGAGRFLVASWWIFSIVMSATYSAKLIANLAVPRADKPFSSLGELLDNTDYKWGVVGRGSTFYLLSTSTDPDIKRLWNSIVSFNRTDPGVLSGSNTQHIDKVLGEKYAYIMGHDKLGAGRDCEVTYLREKIFEYSKGMALPQHSPLKVDFDREMLYLSESGFLNKLAKKWLIADGRCISGRSPVTVVTVEDLQSAFYLLLAGIGSSCTALFVEYIYRLVRYRGDHALRTK